MDRLNKYLSKQKYVVHRSEDSPYRNFLLYVEEIYQVTVVYPIKYLFDIPLKYYEYFKSYKKKDIDNKNLKQFCNIIKEQHEINNEQQKCFCCFCRQDDIVFPLFSHFNYKKAKFNCNKKEQEEDIVLTLSCLKKKDKFFHSFFIQQNYNFFMLNVTLQQFDLNDEYFININDKSTLERKTYILDSSNYEIDDEVFNVKIKFNVQKNYRNDDIEGNYLFVDSNIFQDRIILEDSFKDGDILKNSVIVKSHHVDENGFECNKIIAYPNSWNRGKGLCRFKRNECFHKQLCTFLNLEKKLNSKNNISYNYSFFMIRKLQMDEYTEGDERMEIKNEYIYNINKLNKINEIIEDYEYNNTDTYKHDIKSNNNKETLLEYIENNYYIGLQKERHHFIDIKSHNEESLNISYDEEGIGESVSFVHILSNCYNYNNENNISCSIYLSIWNEEDIEKEINVFIKCEQRIVNDIEQLKKKLFLCKKCEETVLIKFEPIYNMLLASCHVLITKEQENLDIKNINEDPNIRGKNYKEQHFLFVKDKENIEEPHNFKYKKGKYKTYDYDDIVNMDQTIQNKEYHQIDKINNINNSNNNNNNNNNNIYHKHIYIIKEVPLKFNEQFYRSNDHTMMLYNTLNFIENVEDNILRYKRKLFFFMKKSGNIIKIILLLFSVIILCIFIIPSLPFCKYFFIKLKWFHRLKTIRLLTIWKIQDMFSFLKKIPKKVWRLIKRIAKKCKRLIFKSILFKIFTKYKKDQELIDQEYKEKLERKRKKERKKKAMRKKYQLQKKEKEKLRKKRYKKLIENEKIFKKEMKKELMYKRNNKIKHEKKYQENCNINNKTDNTYGHKSKTEKYYKKYDDKYKDKYKDICHHKYDKKGRKEKNIYNHLNNLHNPSYDDLEKNESITSNTNSSQKYYEKKKYENTLSSTEHIKIKKGHDKSKLNTYKNKQTNDTKYIKKEQYDNDNIYSDFYAIKNNEKHNNMEEKKKNRRSISNMSKIYKNNDTIQLCNKDSKSSRKDVLPYEKNKIVYKI
ncbi:conserved Plasmodium protein, unknown function [Plasmodium sp. DRC-Itaito]|nr:conserved Plasmodium protein, unknown function [Plasmodium sp. DRC-Itaito]